jgi:hypothetical protein
MKRAVLKRSIEDRSSSAAKLRIQDPVAPIAKTQMAIPFETDWTFNCAIEH